MFPEPSRCATSCCCRSWKSGEGCRLGGEPAAAVVVVVAVAVVALRRCSASALLLLLSITSDQGPATLGPANANRARAPASENPTAGDDTPPATSAADHQDYGTRVPLLAIGRFARRNFVSHVTLEHSSIVRFLEWNFTGSTGQLHARDAVVNNLGSLLDPAQTGVPVPAN